MRLLQKPIRELVLFYAVLNLVFCFVTMSTAPPHFPFPSPFPSPPFPPFFFLPSFLIEEAPLNLAKGTGKAL